MNLNDEMNIDLSGELVLRQTEIAPRVSAVKKLADTYNEHAKLVFIFDLSGSMSDKLPRKRDVVELVPAEKLMSRVDVVKKLAKQEIAARFAKYPKSRVAVVVFGDNAFAIFDDGAPEDLWPELDRMHPNGFEVGGTLVPMVDWEGKPRLDANGVPVMRRDGMTGRVGAGGTDILAALRCGMDVCRRAPSAVGIHHFVLVTDGGDGRANAAMGEWTPVLKASGIVLDCIHIGREGEINDGVRRAAIATGGAAVVVSNEDDLETKFVEAAQRLMLPPGN